jgi:hypothetical protein
MNKPIRIESLSIRSIIFTSLKVIYRNFALLLGIFIIAYIPTYLLRAILGQYSLKGVQSLSQIAEIRFGTLLVLIIYFIIDSFKSIFSIITCAMVSEKTILGKPISFINTIKNGISLSFITFITLLPAILFLTILYVAYVLLFSVSLCFSIILIIPLIMISIYLLVIINSIALRGCHGIKAYSYSWNLMKGNWRNFIIGYFVFSLAIIVLSSPILIPTILLLNRNLNNNSVIGDIPGDILTIYIFIGFTIIYLNLVYLQTISSGEKINEKGPYSFLINQK